ncbi:cellulase family glycosylhydrolase [Siccirubricoccus sp. G192]|uniref:cellulase family glycosylhydrolase n=1 Tax=Siccirubricoccus sp. G192 TaxID=2849651 RepID=UPI001C2C2BF8|nr:glycoside hydrolase family 5 protein [Siccirubricoccus sp. G192]
MLAPLNEPAFPDTATWLPMRDRLLAALRRAAPRHTLMWGGHEWCSAASLLEATPPADRNTIAEVHDYAGGDAGAVQARFADMAAWRDRHRLPVLVTELGGPQAHAEDRAALAADLRASLPVLRRLRLPATLWTYTHGGWWRLQPGEDSAPYPELRAALG